MSNAPSTTLCNPFFTGRNHESLNLAQIEKNAKKLIDGSREGITFTVLITTETQLQDIICKYIGSLKNSNIKSADKAIWQRAVVEMNAFFARGSLENSQSFFMAYMVQLARIFTVHGIETPCLCSLNESICNLVLAKYKNKTVMVSVLEISDMTESFRKLKNRGWKASEISALKIDLMEKLEATVLPEVPYLAIQDFFKLIDETVTPIRLIQFAQITVAMIEANYKLPIGTMPFSSSLGFWQQTIHSMAESSIAELAEIGIFKIRADRAVSEKTYGTALAEYSVMNFLGVHSVHLIQSLANAAALRLRLSPTEPEQYGLRDLTNTLLIIPLAILECTLALEIEPKHVKALFRRGLALALSKRWNEAIIDFERAIELDPLSPAKKELEVARRQVMRRIGN